MIAGMRKISAFLILIPVLLLLISCKKEPGAGAAFSANGYWVGQLSSGSVMGIMNYPDGASRLYISGGSLDTLNADVTYTGTYTVDGDFFYAEHKLDSMPGFSSRVFVESTNTTPGCMTGVLVQNGLNGTAPIISSHTFNVTKQ